MKRTITSALVAAALTVALAVPALADSPYVLVDINVECQVAGVQEVGRIPDGPPGQVRPLIAQWFRTTDCDPGTKVVRYEPAPVTFQSVCSGLGGTPDPDDPGTCDWDYISWSDFVHAKGALARTCRGHIVWIIDSGGGKATVICSSDAP